MKFGTPGSATLHPNTPTQFNLGGGAKPPKGGTSLLNAIPTRSREAKEEATRFHESFESIVGEAGTPCRFIKKKQLGKGSFGEAWLVRASATSDMCVAKVMNLWRMSDRDRAYAYGEIQCLSHVHHPNVVRYYESVEKDGKLLIIMEFADGGDLDALIKRRAALSIPHYFMEHEVCFGPMTPPPPRLFRRRLLRFPTAVVP